MPCKALIIIILISKYYIQFIYIFYINLLLFFFQVLVVAAKEGDLARVKLEIEAGTWVDTIDCEGYTALIWVSG